MLHNYLNHPGQCYPIKGVGIVQLVECPTEKPSAKLTRVRVPGAARDFFLTQLTFSADSLTVSVQPPCAITRINICAYVKCPKQWYAYQRLGCLTCTQMLMHAIARGGCTDTVRESALKGDSGRKILCCTEDLNPCQYCAWLFSLMLYQLSCSCPCRKLPYFCSYVVAFGGWQGEVISWSKTRTSFSSLAVLIRELFLPLALLIREPFCH